MQIVWENYDLQKAKALAAKFGSAVVTEMQHNISKLDLVQKKTLLESIKSRVVSKDGFVDRITFTYEWYGRIFENGANNVFGKGVTIEPKQWRSPAISMHLDELNQDYATFFAQLIADNIKIDEVKLEM